MFGVDKMTVALEVGGSYGVITETLARMVGTVYAVEADSEQIEFTRVRLEQANISNVHLIHSASLCLSLPEDSFDLIVVSSGLEWIAKWSQHQDPVSAQRAFLNRVRQLLKDTGVLVIRCKNLPRYKRSDKQPHSPPSSGTAPQSGSDDSIPQTHGAPFTHLSTRRKCQRLLEESGFRSTCFYWVDPGYEQSFSLVPLKRSPLSRHFRNQVADSLRFSGIWWKLWCKLFLGRLGLVDLFAREVLVFAGKHTGTSEPPGARLRERIREQLPANARLIQPSVSLSTYTFGRKNIMLFSDLNRTGRSFIVKTSTAGEGSSAIVEADARHLELVWSRLQCQKEAKFSVPQRFGSFQIGSVLYSVESCAPGMELGRLLSMQPSHRQFTLLKEILPRCVEIAAQLALMFRGERSVSSVRSGETSVWDVLEIVACTQPEFRHLVQIARAANWNVCEDGDDWVQHGDLTVDNIMVDPTNKQQLTLIDWSDMVRGVPRLYDVFTLLVSVFVKERGKETDEQSWSSSFLDTFFGRGPAAKMTRYLLVDACSQLSLRESCVWPSLLSFLVLRIHHYFLRVHPLFQANSSFFHPMTLIHARLLHLALRNSENFLLRP